MGDYITSIYHICYYEGSTNSKKSSAYANLAHTSGPPAKPTHTASGRAQAHRAGGDTRVTGNPPPELAPNWNNLTKRSPICG